MNYKEISNYFLSKNLLYELYKLYSKFISKEQLNKIFAQQLIAQAASQIIITYLKVNILANLYSAIYTSYDLLKRDNRASKNQLDAKLKRLTIFIPIYAVSYYINGVINIYFKNNLNQILTPKLNEELLNIESIITLKESSSIDAKMLIRNLKSDIELVTYKGNSLLNDQFSTIIAGLYAINSLSSLRSSIIYSLAIAYNHVTGYFEELALTKQADLIKPIKNLESKLITLEEYLATNARQILRTDSEYLVKTKREVLTNKLNTFKNNKAFWDIVIEDMWIIEEIIAFAFNYAVSANEILVGRLTEELKWKYVPVLKEFSNMYLWDVSNKYEIYEVFYAIERINKLSEKTKSLNEINKLVYFNESSNNKAVICFKDFFLKVVNKTISFERDLCLSNKVTAVTGTSGCGKSTFLDSIKSIQYDLKEAKGKIIYNYDAKVTILSQEINIMPDISLLEIITQDELHFNKVIALLKEFSLGNFVPLLNQRLDWQEYLSGGEKKLIAIINLIIANPSIALLDEVFNGLSSDLVYFVQDMMVKHLPNTMFLVVDHEAQNHNKTGFYQDNLHFSNDISGTIVNLQDFF